MLAYACLLFTVLFMATTYRNPESKFWYARFTDRAGRRISRSTKSESRREAKRIAAELEAAEHRSAKEQDVPRLLQRAVEMASLESQSGTLTLQRAEQLIRQMTQAANPNAVEANFRRFAASWLDMREPNIEKSTWRTYSEAIKAGCKSLGKKAEGSMRKIGIDDAEKMQSYISQGRRGKTTNYYMSVLRRIFEAALQRDLIAKNPLRGIKAMPTGDSTSRLPFTAAEVRRIIDQAATEEWKGLILLAAHTGLRCGDLLRLSSANIDGTRLKVMANKTAKKSGDVLQIPLTPPCLAWLDGRKGELFPSIRILKSTTTSQTFCRFMRAAQVAQVIVLAPGDPPKIARRSFHSLRHTFTTWLAEADIHSDIRRKLTGHHSDGIHGKYSHHNEALDRAIATLPSI